MQLGWRFQSITVAILTIRDADHFVDERTVLCCCFGVTESLQVCSDQLPDFGGTEWFFEKRDGAKLFCLMSECRVAMSGDHYCWNCLVQGGEFFEQFQAVDVRHLHVDNEANGARSVKRFDDIEEFDG
mgnify:CR=1 FL=1